MIYLGADHAGFDLKEKIKLWLTKNYYQICDEGAKALDSQDDYNEFAAVVSQEVLNFDDNLGILFCHSGIGMSIASNRHVGIRAAIAWNEEVAKAAKRENNANILILPAGFLDEMQAQAIVRAWLEESFLNNEKYSRRNQKLDH